MCLSRLAVCVVVLVALTSIHASARAQDDEAKAKKVADDATAKLKEIQKALAAGKEAPDKDNPNVARLRIDGFRADGKQVKVSGVFLDTGEKPKGNDPWSSAFASARTGAEKVLDAQVKSGDIVFDWTGVARVGSVDANGNKSKYRPPHLLVQEAANKAGESKPAADRLAVTGARFGPAGELVFVGIRAKDAAVQTWLEEDGLKALAEHPAVGKARVSWADVKPVEWTASAADLQKVFADMPDKAYHRLFVSRAYCAIPDPPLTDRGWEDLVFRLDGICIGATALLPDAGMMIEPAVRGHVAPVWKKMTAGTAAEPVQVDTVKDLVSPLAEPYAELQQTLSAIKQLDGVRVDPGFTFSAEGGLRLAGIDPELEAADRKVLEEAVQKGLVAYSKSNLGEEKARKYALLAARPVSAAGMTRLPIRRVKSDLHDWVMRNRDDVRLLHLYFVNDPKTLAGKNYAGAENGGGLVLVYQATSQADLDAVKAEFQKIFKQHFKDGIPDAKVPAKDPKAKPAGDEKINEYLVPRADFVRHVEFQKTGDEKGPLLPGLTAEIRKRMAGDQKKWYGVLIEHGYFDTDNRYTIAGVVDSKEQNAELAKLLDELKTDERWRDYFTPAPNAPNLAVIPMKEMLDRVQRVTPAYTEFDGARVTSARYDEAGNLVFEVHVVSVLDPVATPLLAQLLRAHPTYRRRAPVDKRVLIVKTGGPPYSDTQVADFSLGYGAELLAKGEMKKAKEWLEVGLLHYPNESAVWFLSAYYNQLNGDAELVGRDLQRVIELEGRLQFNGPAQRKRRYEAAKDLQGPKRVALEDAWLARFREVRDGAKPITLAASK
jgi:hypothetical protein